MTPRMLDLFAGLGGASAAMRARGWEVVRVELDPAFGPEIVADLGGWRAPRALRGVDLLWASPPCTEFSREAMPWCRTGRPPSLELVRATLRIVEAVRPRFWCLENVRGAIPHLRPLLGPPIASSGPVFLWGRLPAGLTLRCWPDGLAGRRVWGAFWSGSRYRIVRRGDDVDLPIE